MEEPLTERQCLHAENGCTWQTPSCCIPTIVEAEWYVKAHGSECTLNPVVVEERQHRWQQEDAAWRKEEAAAARHMAAKDEAEDRHVAAKARRVAAEDRQATKAKKCRRKRDYRRQREAQEAVPPASRPMVQDYAELRPMVQDYAKPGPAEATQAHRLVTEEAGTGPMIHDTCGCYRDDW